jgi:hypothetical protein
MGCGAETEANTLLTALTAGTDFTVPPVDLTDPEFVIPALDGGVVPAALTNADLTDGVVTGDGTFDIVMKAIGANLAQEFSKGRITGDQYSKVYLGAMEAALGNSVQFLLGRDNAYWQALKAKYEAQRAQIEVVTARVALEVAKAELQKQRYEALTHQANYALTKLKLSTESVGYCIANFNLTEILPSQAELLGYQVEAARAQTMDTQTDGIAPIAGLIGKQKDLYSQQITSYKRDSEVKIAKLFTDAWITQKTIDEGLLAPTGFTNVSLDQVLDTLKANVQFDGLAHP